MSTKKLDNIIKSFCSIDELRPLMCSPWEHEGNIIATNAHMLVVAPKAYFDLKYDNDPENKRPRYQSVIPIHDKSVIESIDTKKLMDELIILDTHDYYENCENCEGYGVLLTKGKGKEVECEDCDGTGHEGFIGNLIPSIWHYNEDEARYIVKFNELYFDPNFFLTICRLASTLDAKTINLVHEKKNAASIFYINEILILLMPFEELDIDEDDIGAPMTIDLKDFLHV